MNRSAERRLGSMIGCLKLAGTVPGAPFPRFMDPKDEWFRRNLSGLGKMDNLRLFFAKTGLAFDRIDAMVGLTYGRILLRTPKFE